MRAAKLVWVEKDSRLQVFRIFRNRQDASAAARHIGRRVIDMFYGEAVGMIRHTVFIRSQGFCEGCAAPVTESTGHMHELLHRGKGGEISMDNSVFICADCHKFAHKDRSPIFSKKSLDI
jgi:hypothetical protein